MVKKEINPDELVEYFEVIEDPGMDRTKDHKWVDIILIALCAVISGAEGWREIEEFGLAKEEWFRRFLELEKGIPSHDTFRRVFIILDPKEFKKVFLSWVQSATTKLSGEIISIDGKTAQGSQKNGKAVLHTVSAWAHDEGIVLGQVKTEEKSNEITAIPELLKIIDVKGCTVRTDAMGCQKKISKEIRKRGGDYVLALKGNQGLLHEEVEWYLRDAKERKFKGIKHSFYETTEKIHGRKDERKYWITEDIGWLSTKKDWKDLISIGMACTRTEVNGKVSVSEEQVLFE